MGEILLRKAFDDYQTIYMPYRNFAERTRVEYQNDLKDLIEFLEKSGIKHVGEIGFPIIERYIADLEQRGFASPTRKRKVVAIRSFLFFLYQDGYIASNLGRRIALPFTENTIPHVLTETECNRIRIACSANKRDRAIIELLLQTGITLSELVQLRTDDVEIREAEIGFIRVLGRRGRKERIIPLNAKASMLLENYLNMMRVEKSSILFLNRFDEPLGERGVQKMLRKYLRVAGLKKATIAVLRHTFAVQQLAHGLDLKKVQEIMGLNDKRSTSSYIPLAQEQKTLRSTTALWGEKEILLP